MSGRSDSRRPMAFRLDDPDVVVTVPPALSDDAASQPPSTRGAVLVAPTTDVAAWPARGARRVGIPLGAVFWMATGGLVALGLGLAGTRLIEDLYARAEWLGWLGSGLATLALATLAAMLAREAVGLARLKTVEKLQSRAAAVITTDDRAEAESVVRELISLVRAEPRLARSRAAMRSHLDEIIDGADLIRLAERELMAPLDEEARSCVAAAAKRVSVVTAVSPRAAVDMVFVLVTALGLVRRLADLYGGRPGTLGLVRLFRHVIAHLAVTGGMAAGDGLIQQLLGHGVAAKLSVRLGEGVLNGLLTARLGLAAIEVARPMPFVALTPPALGDLAAGFIKPRRQENTEEGPR